MLPTVRVSHLLLECNKPLQLLVLQLRGAATAAGGKKGGKDKGKFRFLHS